MQWPYLAMLGQPAGATPVDSAQTSIVSYILSFGPLGVIVLAFAFRWIVPGKSVEKAVETARTEARTDLVAERDRLLKEKQDVEAQRDDALKVLRDQVTPMLISFTSTTQSLLPLLQELVLSRETPGRRRRGGPDP